MSNYSKYRGKCKEYVDAAIKKDPTLKAIRGHYYCWLWGKQAHWWCEREDGTIYDPTVKQFPIPHIGEYVPFDGYIECEHCGKRVKEEDAKFCNRYALCSTACCMRLVGL